MRIGLWSKLFIFCLVCVDFATVEQRKIHSNWLNEMRFSFNLVSIMSNSKIPLRAHFEPSLARELNYAVQRHIEDYLFANGIVFCSENQGKSSQISIKIVSTGRAKLEHKHTCTQPILCVTSLTLDKSFSLVDANIPLFLSFSCSTYSSSLLLIQRVFTVLLKPWVVISMVGF